MKTKRQLESSIKKHRRAVLLVNTRSRRGEALYQHAEELLRARGISLEASYAIKDLSKLRQTVERALSHRPELLIVGSGDGTVAEIVDHLAYQDTVVGFLPLGTTNNFARSIGIPLDLEAAADVIAKGKVADIDLGNVNGDYFANVASIGISVDIAQNVPHKLKRRYGRLAYAFTGASQLRRHRSFKVTIEANGRTEHIQTHQMVIANGRFHGGSLIANDAHIDSHELVIFYLGDKRKFQLVRSMILYAFKRKRTLKEGNYIITKEARIITSPKRRVELDGEIKETTPIDISVATNALKIMVPTDFSDD